jgi:hypothetical protein
MGRWAEAFQEYSHGHDTADTVDTSYASPADPNPSVSSVNSVMGLEEPKRDACPLAVELVSAVSAVSRLSATDTAISQVGRLGISLGTISSHTTSTLRRPPAWAEAADQPPAGCFCSCRRSTNWWTEVCDSRGWRCRICHPPDHLPADMIMEART